jgi:hypothetical protein
MISLLNIAEQCQAILGKGTAQELLQSVRNFYGVSVKTNWFEGKEDGVSEINGSFQYTYKDIKPILDEDLGQYYITIPSSYLELPHQLGINHVSFMKGQDSPFATFATSHFAMFSGLKSSNLGGMQAYSIEGNKMYFPYMDESDIKSKGEIQGILLKMTIGLDDVDVDEQLNISPAIISEIVTSVVTLYQSKEKGLTDSLV